MPFQDAYERILQSTGLRTQTDVAALLGVKQSSISDAKRRNHIPDSQILTLFNKKGLRSLSRDAHRRRPAVCGGNGYAPDACFVGTAGGREP